VDILFDSLKTKDLGTNDSLNMARNANTIDAAMKNLPRNSGSNRPGLTKVINILLLYTSKKIL